MSTEAPKKSTARRYLYTAPPWMEPEHATVKIYTDVSKRVAQCNLCKRPIGKKQLRVVTDIRRANGRRTQKGGWISKDRYFAHATCMQKSLSELPTESGATCFDCGIPKTPDGPGVLRPRCFTGRRTGYGLLCDGCRHTYRWVGCYWCQIYFPPAMTVQVIDDGADLPVPQELRPACRFCASELKMYTNEDLKRDNQEFERYRKAVAKEVKRAQRTRD